MFPEHTVVVHGIPTNAPVIFTGVVGDTLGFASLASRAFRFFTAALLCHNACCPAQLAHVPSWVRQFLEPTGVKKEPTMTQLKLSATPSSTRKKGKKTQIFGCRCLLGVARAEGTSLARKVEAERSLAALSLHGGLDRFDSPFFLCSFVAGL